MQDFFPSFYIGRSLSLKALGTVHTSKVGSNAYMELAPIRLDFCTQSWPGSGSLSRGLEFNQNMLNHVL